MMTCQEILNLICSHSDGFSIFVCLYGWGYEANGNVILKDITISDCITLIGDRIPDDWIITTDIQDRVSLGFLFK